MDIVPISTAFQMLIRQEFPTLQLGNRVKGGCIMMNGMNYCPSWARTAWCKYQWLEVW